MSTKIKKILVLTDWYLPGYKAGGPIRSLANLISTLTDIEFFVVTRNTDHYSTKPYEGVQSNQWTKQSDNCHVYYFEEQNINLSALKTLIEEREYDKIYLNSLFSPKFTILPLIAISKLRLKHRTILAPRGMLKAGALSLKANKKKAFLGFSKLLGFFKGVSWHATSTEEMEEIKLHFPNASSIVLAPNIATPIGSKPEKPNKISGELKLICIARISAEKGIKEGLHFLESARLQGKVSCDFYGTIQDPVFLKECLALTSKIGGIEISFKGEVSPHQIPSLLQSYHFFYLPTLGENFGHAIAEALNNATPVIISNKTPWKDLQTVGVGWDLPLEESEFSMVLNQCLEMDNAIYRTMSDKAYQFALSISKDDEVIRAQRVLFESNSK